MNLKRAIFATTLLALGTSVGTVSAQVSGETTFFNVTKDFTDNNQGTVTVEIACNTGLILDQDFDLGDGENVVFQVDNFIDADGFWCEITESDTAGYVGTFVANQGSPSVVSCMFTAGQSGNMNVGSAGRNTCAITNTPDYVDVVVGKEWLIPGSGGNDVDMSINIQARSLGQIKGGTFSSPYWYKTLNFYGENPSDQKIEVRPVWNGMTVFLSESGYDSGTEVENTCGTGTSGSVIVKPADGASCTFTNTVFFEGIPTLNQYGMAIMALLMLGIGFVGFRRFV